MLALENPRLFYDLLFTASAQALLKALQNTMEDSNSYHYVARAALLVAIVVCASAFLVLASRTFPVGDDLCRAVAVPVAEFPPQVLPVGLVNSVVWTYQHWSGRWVGVGLETILLPRVPGRYPWLLGLVAVAQICVLYAALHIFLSQRRAALFYTALFTLVLWAGLPSTEGVFWIPGVIESQLALPFAFLLFMLLISPDAQSSKGRLFRNGLAIILAFLLPAFHELLGSLLVLVLIAAMIAAIRSGSPRCGAWIATCAAAVVSFIIVFVAPGNAARAATITHHAQIVRTLKLSLDAVHSYLLPWCLDLKHWLLAVIVCLDPMLASDRKRFPAISPRQVAVLIVGLLGLIVASMVAGLWNLGHPLAGRTLDLLYGVFLVGWIAISFIFASSLDGLSLSGDHRQSLVSACVTLVAVAAIFSANTVSISADVATGRLGDSYAQFRRRFQLLRSSEPSSDVTLPPITVFTSPNLKHGYITTDPAYWSNRCMAAYFGVHSVRTEMRPDGYR